MTELASKRPIVLAAGGTGGHIFPAEALAETLMGMGERVILVTDSRFAQFKTGALSRIEVRTIRAGTPSGSLLKKIRGGLGLLAGIFQARTLLRSLEPKVVVGFGGYPSFPTVFSASRLGVPTIIHEQNSVLGRANRLLAPRVSCIAMSLPNTQHMAEGCQDKIRMTGNPVRTSIRALRDVPYADIQPDGKLRLLVTGGSLGATVFSDVVPQAVSKLPPSLRARIRIDQQCREPDMAKTQAAYQAMGVNVDLAPFFVDLPARLASAHLVIARAGASTVAELAAAGRPAILVPLPSAMDNHQYHNAIALEEVGGGWVMTQDGFTAESLAARLEAFLTAPATLSRAAEQAKLLGSTDAAERLATLVLDMARSGHDAHTQSRAAAPLKYVAAVTLALCLPHPSFGGHKQLYDEEGANPSNWCRNGHFSAISADFLQGSIADDTPLMYDDDGEAPDACPSQNTAQCPTKRKLQANTTVVVSKKLGDFYCVYDPHSASSGWVHTQSLAIEPQKDVGLADWLGQWSDGFNTINITQQEKKLRVDGEAVWYGAMLESGEQVVHVGELGFLGLPEGRRLQHSEDDEYDCAAELIRVGAFMVARDNGRCGGLNVSFSGVYSRATLSEAPKP